MILDKVDIDKLMDWLVTKSEAADSNFVYFDRHEDCKFPYKIVKTFL